MEKEIRVRNGKYSVRVSYRDANGLVSNVERGGFKTKEEAVLAREEMLRTIGA